MNISKCAAKVLAGERINKEEALLLMEEATTTLSKYAEKIRTHFCGQSFELCTIINGKSGKCSENCAYCAQSSHFKTAIQTYNLLTEEIIVNSAKSNAKQGVHRFSIVTSGKRLSEEEVEKVSCIYKKINETCKIGLCASHGLLRFDQLQTLQKSGVKRYHNNLETSERFFKKICTTHTYAEKIETLKNAKRAGMEICSGGIIGLGETMEDRIDLALCLRALEVDSVPVNVLNPIPGTALENNKRLTNEEVSKTLSIFRFILPGTQIRLAGGRALLGDKGRLAMKSGVNAAISGDMLTTEGIKTVDDIKMIKALGFEVKIDD
ncbi:MAG: biotin synthase BioB [Eubacterium sp.]